ncbi:chaperonin 10-like protein [Thamnidium elegans]|nr:chaperonin 10-like protein [Thamnidium elegans]
MADDRTFNAWACTGKDKPLTKMQLTLREWTEDCVELDITHCGICGSDVHTMDSGWGPTEYPCVVGHEIVGVVKKVGKNVTKVKVGDRAGVGAQCNSCRECKNCLEGSENLCMKGIVGTYNARWENGDKTYGGYADRWRGDYRFVFKVPDNMSSAIACTFFCAGVTTYAPLKRCNVNSSSVVGVMGLGGLGHYGVKWAKAMGAKVIGMSHNDKKREIALELGCDEYLNTSDKEAFGAYRRQMTHILCTGTGRDFDWVTYLSLIVVNGHFINISIPEWNFPEINPFVFFSTQVFISGSAIGSPAEIEDMLEFASVHDVEPWIQTYKMDDVVKAIEDFRAGKPRFRIVLEN